MKNLHTFWSVKKQKEHDPDDLPLKNLLKKRGLKALFFFIFLFSSQVFATDYTINSINEFNNLNLSPGDVVIWENGTYNSDERLTFRANGTASNPITLKAETPGGVIFNNGLQMNIAGNYLIVEGFHWKGGYGASNFIQFRNGTTYAQNSTIRNCVIDGLGVEPGDAAEAEQDGAIVKHRWIVLYGNNNSVLNCSFLNKSTAGALVLVELEYNAEVNRCDIVGHTISNNYFYKYEKMDPSLSNSGDSETIRVGTSEFQNVDCRTTVSNNYFVEADGENEIITNKSDNNTYQNNTFRRCRGSLTLRHGSGATVQGNYFLGENVDGTGGIRIVDSDHTITNNYIQDCITVIDQAKWNNGITFMGGSTNSQDDCNATNVSNGYQKSEDITVANNTIVNTNAPLFFNGDKGTNRNTGDVNNNVIFFSSNSSNITDVITEDDNGDFSSIGSTLSYSGNVYNNTNLGASVNGFSSTSLSASNNGEIFSISGTNAGSNISQPPFTDSDVAVSVGACFVNSTGNSLNSCSNTPPTDVLTLSAINDFAATAGSQTLTIASNVNWTISDNSSWITVSPTSGVNNGNATISVTTNSESSTRTGTVTVSGGNLTRTITITQLGVAGTVSVTGVAISPSSSIIEIGNTQQLTATISPNNATNQNTTYNSNNPSVATINSNGVINAISTGEAIITVTAEDGGFTDTATITVITPTTGDNLALNKPVTATGTPDGNNIADNLVDGSTNSRWSVNGFPQSFTVDLGESFSINKTEFVFHQDRAYQYIIETATSANGTYTEIVDRSNSSTPGTVSAPVTDSFSSVNARYVRVTVSGAFGYSGPWISILEFRVFGNAIDIPNCTAGSNLSLNANISSYSNQQTANPASNIIDDNTDNRWSAEGFPQNAVIDLGEEYAISEIEVYPYNNRAYQFVVEGSSTSATSGFSILTDASNNTSGGSVITRSFSTQTVRYVKLTVTGASGYSGNWSSINEFRVICAGSSQSLSNRIGYQEDPNISIYPNPFTTSLTVQLSKNNTEITSVQLIDMYGREVSNQLIDNSSNSIHFSTSLPKGVYFLRLLNSNNRLIKTEKVISN
ncbi:T9SS C-terminal target domain-containing protein [Aquimarina sp. BL5]|uniref:chondroitinase-B domain-containing protein n=1 Tax=Aquimarina sp. BL5 TaxID=1714860 RepID=UPI000E4B064D|nr:chondroitinase-B domain-containing protein [Aquimarina sp. BL5]AXT52859.1 T9SS C-terminal target domain-containing protein [Aquimarina sp. BL5]RKN07517.1 T9SS C-terminal target domain-containing protein [Aquimarina sp. BL5]